MPNKQMNNEGEKQVRAERTSDSTSCLLPIGSRARGVPCVPSPLGSVLFRVESVKLNEVSKNPPKPLKPPHVSSDLFCRFPEEKTGLGAADTLKTRAYTIRNNMRKRRVQRLWEDTARIPQPFT